MLLPSSDKLRLCALQTHAAEPGTKQHSSGKGRGTLCWKCGRSSVSLGLWDKLPWTAQRQKKKLKMPVSLQRYKLSAQTELVTGTGQKDQKTRVSWGSQSCSEYSMTGIGERLNSAKQPRGSDPRPISAVGEHFTKSKSWWWAWETNSQRQLKIARDTLEGLVRDIQSQTSQPVSVMSDRPFPYRQCKTGAFSILRITLIHRLNLPTANLQRQCQCLCAARQPISHSPTSQHFRHGQQLRLPAGAEGPCSPLLTPCTTSSL